jgi:effector-binding domain-containing protein
MTAYAVRLQEIPSVPVAVVRRRVAQSELSRVVPECCGLVWNELRAQKTSAGRNIAIYWNGDIRLEAGVELTGPFTETASVVRSATPAGSVAFVTHVGPYHRLGAAHDAVQQWCAANGHRLAGPRWEIYGHWQPEWNDNPALIRTDVFYRVNAAP